MKPGAAGSHLTTIKKIASAVAAMSATNVSSTSAQMRAQAGKRFVARSSELSKNKQSAAESGGVGTAGPATDV